MVSNLHSRLRRLNRVLPPGHNRWFRSRQSAYNAAQHVARRLGPGFIVRHHVYPQVGVRHFHIRTPDGRYFRMRFCYVEVPPPDGFIDGEADLLTSRAPRQTQRVARTYYINWLPPIRLDALPRPNPNKDVQGVYLIYKDGKPIYVGRSRKVYQRLRDRFEHLRQAAVNFSPYEVYVGELTLGQYETRPITITDLDTVEHTLIRRLGGRPNLTNTLSTSQFRIVGASPWSALFIRNNGNKPPHLPVVIKMEQGVSKETDL